MQEEYRALSSSTDAANSSVAVEVTILTSGYWPIPSTANYSFEIPPCVQTSISQFTSFYLDKHNGRKITWLCAQGTADIRAKFHCGEKEFNVSSLQMCILYLFNDKSSFSLADIREKCQVSDEVELKRHLLSLCTPKAKILLKSSKGKAMGNDDIFTVNDGFESKYRRIKVPLIATKEIVGDSKAGRSENALQLPPVVEESRKLAMEAAIVRTMKARKSFRHNDLIVEVTRQLAGRFPCVLVDLKKSIESLIEREYLCRDDTDRSCYQYLA